MKRARRAVIDIGTNSVKLLVADVDGHRVTPLMEATEQTRLGKGFYETHLLQADTIEHTTRSVVSFLEPAYNLDVTRPRIIATSAARDARNSEDLVRAIEQAAQLPLEIISGEQEAEWAFQGVTTDPLLAKDPLLLLDVGGGSTEMIVGAGGHHSFRQSFPMGSVRLLEKLRPSDPPTLEDMAGCRDWLSKFFNQEIGPALDARLDPGTRSDCQLVGTGGTSTLLARMERKATGISHLNLDGLRLSQHHILSTMIDLWSQPLAKRQSIPGLPASRADIILMGVAIYESVMTHFQFDNLYVSMRGLRFGAILCDS